MLNKLVVGVAVAFLSTQLGLAEDSRPASVLTESHKAIFFLQLVVIFGTLAIFVPLCRRLKVDDFVGEILVGVLLGCCFIAVAPELHAHLFPDKPEQRGLLELFAELGVLFLLLQSGIEISPEAAWKHKKAAFWIGIGGLVLPILAGYLLTLGYCKVFEWVPPRGISVHIFAFFMGNTMAISSMVIIVRLFKALDLERTQLGQIVLCAYAMNDILGWIFYGLIFQAASGAGSSTGASILRVVLASALTGVCLKLLPAWVNRAIESISKRKQAAGIYVFVTSLALGLGLLTHYLGVTLYFGVFLAGIVMAGSPLVTAEVKRRLTTFAEYYMTPIFFVLIGMQTDIFQHFDVKWALFITVVSVGTKYLFAALCAAPAGVPKNQWHIIGVSCIPGGVNGIIFGGLALSLGLIDQGILGGIVIAAIVSSVITGPLLKRSLRTAGTSGEKVTLRDCVDRRLWSALPRFDAEDRERALEHAILDKPAAAVGIRAEELRRRLEMVEQMSGLEVGSHLPDRVAYLHCSVPDIRRDRIFFFWSGSDVPWRNQTSVRILVLRLAPEGVPAIEIGAKLMRAIQKIGDAKLTELAGSNAREEVHKAILRIIEEVH